MNNNPMANITLSHGKIIDYSKVLVSEGFTPHWEESQTDEQYHSDKTAIGSSSLRKALISPRAFFYDFFLNEKQPESEAFKIGKIVHTAILEGSKFKQRYVIEPVFTGVTQDGRPTSNPNATDVKRKRANWLADLPKDAIVVTEEEQRMIVGMIDSIMDHPQGLDVVKNGIPEMSGYYIDHATGLRLKIRPDLVGNDFTKLIDIKTTADGTFRRFGSSAFSYRYDIQLFMYAKGIQEITGNFPEVIINLTLEKTPPYECSIYYYTPEDLAMAEQHYHKALLKIKRCIDENKWPQRQKEIQRIYTPSFFMNECEEMENE